MKSRWGSAILFFICFFVCSDCVKTSRGMTTSAQAPAEGESEEIVRVTPDPQFIARTRAAVLKMSDSELAGQVIMSGVDACGTISGGEISRLKRVKPGAIMLFRKNLDTDSESVRIMNSELAAASAVHILSFSENGNDVNKGDRNGRELLLLPFIACDHEGGDVHRFRKDVARLPAPLSYNELALNSGWQAASEQIFSDALKAAAEIHDLGVTMNLAPVVEPLLKENAAFLSTRSYGTDSLWTAEAARKFMLGMESGGVACVVKHFPGNSGSDPHEKLPLLRAGEFELAKAVAPFYSLLNTGIPAAVMVAHSIAEDWDAEHPASLSPVVIKEKLINGGAFYGIVLADDFSMGAVSGSLRTEKTSVEAIAAGVDMVMAWPANLNAIHSAILSALVSGQLDRERLVTAVEHIVYQKIRFGLFENAIETLQF